MLLELGLGGGILGDVSEEKWIKAGALHPASALYCGPSHWPVSRVGFFCRAPRPPGRARARIFPRGRGKGPG